MSLESIYIKICNMLQFQENVDLSLKFVLDFDLRFQIADLFFYFLFDKYLVNVIFLYIYVLFYKKLKLFIFVYRISF